MTFTARMREMLIRAYLRRAIRALERGWKVTAREDFDTAKALIAGRSRSTVAQLERERGLAERSA